MSAGYAAVAVPVPVRRLFTYSVAPSQAEAMAPGVRVRVPFGRRQVEATVVEWPAEAPDAAIETRPIAAVLGDRRRLPPEILELTRFVADYYLCSWGEAIDAALPPESAPARPVRTVQRLRAAEPDRLPARATARRSLLERLPDDGTPVALAEIPGPLRRAVPGLVEMGWLAVEEREPVASRAEAPQVDPPAPTSGQSAVLKQLAPALASGAFSTFVLFGATGSGKTEVYFRAARCVLDRGRSVLYLVPEIGLTPLLLERVAARFPEGAAVLHSGLSARERSRAWDGVRLGRRRLVIGTRSAIFAPLSDLGLIVVDEEQDGSYKQEESPRYNARDLAVVRARSAGAVVLLGSATPSVESFQRAASGRYELLRLGGRVHGRPLPSVRRVDMRQEFQAARQVTFVSRPLIEGLRAAHGRGEQALILRNRRGWASAVLCPTCGQRVYCDRCSITLTWHRRQGRLRCHYCGREERLPETCPTCGADELALLGEGTERIEDLIREAVPEAVVERMDRDTVRRRGAHEALLRRFDSGQIDILVGTQMIAKGHDFPRVTLVGVLSADHSLGLPDYRASERVFQLLTQVAGRAGRGDRPGQVIVQAFDPDHPVLALAAVQDYESFFDHEMRYRRALRYPPLVGLVQLTVQHAQAHRAREWAAELDRALRDVASGRLIISGPGPAPIERLRGRFRQQIIVRSAGRRRLIAAVQQALADCEGKVPRKAVVVDVDPYSLL